MNPFKDKKRIRINSNKVIKDFVRNVLFSMTTNEPVDERKTFWKDVLIFLFGPLIFLFIVKFTGYQIFYDRNDTTKSRKKVIFLLSAGATLYLVVIILLLLLYN